MATITAGYNYGVNGEVNSVNLKQLVESATLSDITEAELDITNSPTTRHLLEYDGSKLNWIAPQSIASLIAANVLASPLYASAFQFIMDGGADPMTSGVKGDLEVPFPCRITNAKLLSNETGTLHVDIWKDTYANFPPTVADTITGGSYLTINNSNKSTQSLASWAISLSAGDILRFNVGCCVSIMRATCSLWVTK